MIAPLPECLIAPSLNGWMWDCTHDHQRLHALQIKVDPQGRDVSRYRLEALVDGNAIGLSQPATVCGSDGAMQIVRFTFSPPLDLFAQQIFLRLIVLHVDGSREHVRFGGVVLSDPPRPQWIPYTEG